MEAIRLNSLAASMLFCGKEEEAIYCLQLSLEALRGLSGQFENAEAEATGFSHGSTCHHKSSLMEESTPLQITVVRVEKVASEGSVEGAFQFYDKIFVVSADPSLCLCPNERSDELQRLLLAVITYNIGSVSQRMGIKYGASRHFAKALLFYNLSSSSIESVLQENGCDGSLTPLLCGLFNNKGHIYARSNDLVETKACLEWLQRTSNAEEFLFCDSMSEEDYSFFSQCVYYSMERHFSAAPAA